MTKRGAEALVEHFVRRRENQGMPKRGEDTVGGRRVVPPRKSSAIGEVVLGDTKTG